jgi:hypothetical protein
MNYNDIPHGFVCFVYTKRYRSQANVLKCRDGLFKNVLNLLTKQNLWISKNSDEGNIKQVALSIHYQNYNKALHYKSKGFKIKARDNAFWKNILKQKLNEKVFFFTRFDELRFMNLKYRFMNGKCAVLWQHYPNWPFIK